MTGINRSGGGIAGTGVNNPRMAAGTASPASNGVLTSFTIPHGLGTTPSSYSVMGGNALSVANPYFVTADATNLTVTYVLAPTTGTLSLKWMAVV
jgi:hypothetical protein